MPKINHLTSRYWCIHTSLLNLPEPSQSSLPHVFVYRCDSYFLFENYVSNSIQSSIVTNPLDHFHLYYHQPLDLNLLDWPTVGSIKYSWSDYHTMDFLFQSYRYFLVTKYSRSISSFLPSHLNTMVNITVSISSHFNN